MLQSLPTIEFASPSHRDAIMTLQKEAYPTIEPESAEVLTLKLTSSPDTCFVIIDKGTISGYLLALPALLGNPPLLNARVSRLDNPNCLYLHDLAIASTARGRGLAFGLINRFFTALSHKNLSSACLISVQNSEYFWHHYGFRLKATTGMLKNVVHSYEKTAVYMEYHSTAVSV